jgi:hypothetical protein
MKPNRSSCYLQGCGRAVPDFRLRSLTGGGACCVYRPDMEVEGRSPAEAAGCMRRGPLRSASTSGRKW